MTAMAFWKGRAMIDFEEARAIALELWPGYDNFTEYPECWTFFDSAHDGDGGFGSPIAVTKADGSRKGYFEAALSGLLSDEVRSGSL